MMNRSGTNVRFSGPLFILKNLIWRWGPGLLLLRIQKGEPGMRRRLELGASERKSAGRRSSRARRASGANPPTGSGCKKPKKAYHALPLGETMQQLERGDQGACASFLRRAIGRRIEVAILPGAIEFAAVLLGLASWRRGLVDPGILRQGWGDKRAQLGRQAITGNSDT